MLLISNCGNLNGVNDKQNTLKHLEIALSHGFDVLIHVWRNEVGFFLDEKFINKIPLDWLRKNVDKCWIKAMNLSALNFFNTDEADFNCFYLDNNFSITSHQYVLVTNDNEIPDYGVALFPESNEKWNISKSFAICSNYIRNYQKQTEFRISTKKTKKRAK